MTIFFENLTNFRGNIFLLTFSHHLRMKRIKFCTFLSNLFAEFAKCKFFRKTCYCKLTQNYSLSTESDKWRFIKKLYTQINYDYAAAALNWLLWVIKSSNWGPNTKKTEIRNLKNWNKMHSFQLPLYLF